MTLAEHNAKWSVTRLPAESVFCHTLGYGEISQYDPDCASCWLGHLHTWREHDRMLEHHAAGEVADAEVSDVRS